MVLAASTRPDLNAPGAAERLAWHDLECGRYSVDVPLWLELADVARVGEAPSRVLDVGAGSGRVSLALARAGVEVTALDHDSALLAGLSRRAQDLGTPLHCVCEDARSFSLPERGFDLCIVPMQTLQLLGGSDERARFLRAAHGHLRPGGSLACAIVTDVDRYDCSAGDEGPAPDSERVDGRLFVSRAVRVSVTRAVIRIERERRIFSASSSAGAVESEELDVIELDRVSPARLAREARRAGFEPGGLRTVSATEEHVGSEVVVFHA